MSTLPALVEYVAGLGRIAKEVRCQIDGIGVDLAPTLFGAHEIQLIGTATIHQDPHDVGRQYQQFSEAAALMRTGWSVTGLALLCEAFVGVGAAAGGDHLASEFANGNPDVHECLLIVGADDTTDAIVCALPYRYEVGRKVVWGEPLSEAAVPTTAGPYLLMLARMFEARPVPMPQDTEAAINAIADVIAAVGFVVQTFDDVDVRYPKAD